MLEFNISQGKFSSYLINTFSKIIINFLITNTSQINEHTKMFDNELLFNTKVTIIYRRFDSQSFFQYKLNQLILLNIKYCCLST